MQVCSFSNELDKLLAVSYVYVDIVVSYGYIDSTYLPCGEIEVMKYLVFTWAI